MSKPQIDFKTGVMNAATAIQLGVDIARELIGTGNMSDKVQGSDLNADTLRQLIGTGIKRELAIQSVGAK